MSDTIKINREMLREAIENARNYPPNMHYPAAIEMALFGPPKPREWTLYFGGGPDSHGATWQCSEPKEVVRVREVLE